MTECEDYGMGHGCDRECPVFDRGDCELQEENEEEFSEWDDYYEDSYGEIEFDLLKILSK